MPSLLFSARGLVPQRRNHRPLFTALSHAISRISSFSPFLTLSIYLNTTQLLLSPPLPSTSSSPNEDTGREVGLLFFFLLFFFRLRDKAMGGRIDLPLVGGLPFPGTLYESRTLLSFRTLQRGLTSFEISLSFVSREKVSTRPPPLLNSVFDLNVLPLSKTVPPLEKRQSSIMLPPPLEPESGGVLFS